MAGATPFGGLSASTGPVGRTDRLYAAALRHSRRVRLLRRAIPVGSMAAIGFILVVAIFEPFRALPAGVSIGGVSLNGTKITMELPKLTGFKKDSRPYEVTAQWAAQDIKSPNVIELKRLTSRIAMQDRSMATVEALNGVYDSQTETMSLRDDVRIRTQTGYDVRMKSAEVAFKAGTVKSAEPLSVLFNGGSIDASAVDMSDNGQHITFVGPVRTTIQADPSTKAAPAAKDIAP